MRRRTQAADDLPQRHAVMTRTLERAEQQARHDHENIGELYAELSDVYQALSQKR